MAKKNKENKQLLELGQKQRAGRLLSEYIRAIGDERTELVDVIINADKVEHRLISKAERMAREIWDNALEGADEKLKLEYRKLVIDRIEGKVGTGLIGTDIEHPGRDVPDRVSEENRKRLNRMAQSGEKKTKKT